MPSSPVRRACVALAGFALVAGAAGCAKKSDNTIAVTGTNDACTPATTSLAAGKVTFEFTNKADRVSELYVLRADESVVGEVENVTTGTKRSLTADLSAGEYYLVCKPGQEGDGLRTEIVVTGTGGAAAPVADRTIAVGATNYAFTLPAGASIKKGETITFTMKNDGPIEHEMEVFLPDGDALGEIGPTKSGETGTVTLTFDEAGTYRLVCGIDGHEEEGMVASIEATG
jgi:uncharacterized cupredoxin-like copper-binding protein